MNLGPVRLGGRGDDPSSSRPPCRAPLPARHRSHRRPTATKAPQPSARRSVSRTVDGAAPTRTAIDLWPSPCSTRYLSISRTRRISSLSAGIPFLPLTIDGRNVTPAEHPRPHPIRRGRHHLGIRGRLILGIGGRASFRNQGADCLGICKRWRQFWHHSAAGFRAKGQRSLFSQVVTALRRAGIPIMLIIRLML